MFNRRFIIRNTKLIPGLSVKLLNYRGKQETVKDLSVISVIWFVFTVFDVQHQLENSIESDG